nr:hypothetical protein [Acidimicrobiia bacterium]
MRGETTTPEAPPDTRPETTAAPAGGIGTSPARPDGVPKVKGEFAFSSDMWDEDMLW